MPGIETSEGYLARPAIICRCGFIVAVGLLSSCPAIGDEFDVVNFVASISKSRDDNVFLLSDGVSPKAFVGRPERWDELTETEVGVRIDKPYSLQRFKFDFTMIDTRHQNYGFLDFKAKNYHASWLWALTPYLTGTLAADRTQSQSGFSDYRGFQSANNTTNETRHFDADFSPYGNWHLVGGVSKYSYTNSQTFNEQSSTSSSALDYGVRYVFTSGSSLKLMQRRTAGDYSRNVPDYANQLDTGYQEENSELGLDWTLTGKSRLNFKLAYAERTHDHLPRRDYAVPYGGISYTWIPTGKLQLQLATSRNVESYQTSTSSYTTSDSVSLSPTWIVSEKFNVQGSIGHAVRKFEGNGVVGAPDIGREDRSRFASLQAAWTPRQFVTVSGALQFSSRSSNLKGLDFDDKIADVKAQFNF